MNPSWFEISDCPATVDFSYRNPRSEINGSVPACPCTFLQRLKLETGDAMFLVVVVIHLVQVQEAK